MFQTKLLLLLQKNNIDFLRNGNSNHIPGNIILSFKGIEGKTLLHRLDLMGICVSTGSACDSVNTQVSHVLQAMNVDHSYSKGTVRLSLGKDNTSYEVKNNRRQHQKDIIITMTGSEIITNSSTNQFVAYLLSRVRLHIKR